ncbi:unnamed protein product [Parnassius apollo]|uniref:(apollo) hypothetical protein n=1 Tax=Parnassius apollo TaxID=110799 RepID=A0A8S3WV71_PARAO|nr:unnamed protein product [Parnassius apollo]
MLVRLLQFILIIGAFKGTWERNHGIETRADIDNILKAIKSSEDSNEDNHEHKDKDTYINRNGNNNAEIIDLNTLNSIVKRILNSDKREQFNEDDFNRYLRNRNEALCRKIGRCGCRPGITRCGDTAVSNQKTVKDMEYLLNGLQEKVDRGLVSEEGKEDDLHYKTKHNVDKYNPKNYIDLNNVFSDRDDLFGQKDLFKLGKQKTYNLNSVSDHTPNYKTYRYDENGPFILQLDDISNEPELINNDEREFSRSENINPDVFFKLFNHMRENMINILFEYAIYFVSKFASLEMCLDKHFTDLVRESSSTLNGADPGRPADEQRSVPETDRKHTV